MTNYFVGNDGIKTTINDDLFDLLWNSFESDEVSTTDSDSSEIIKKEKKKVYNDRLNEKNRNEGYFNEYLREIINVLSVKGVVKLYQVTPTRPSIRTVKDVKEFMKIENKRS